MTRLVPVVDVAAAVRQGSEWDAVVAVFPDPTALDVSAVAGAAQRAIALDAQARSSVTLQPAAELAGGRLILAPTGPIGRDHDDVRRFGDAARDGIRRARDAGARQPLLLVAATGASAAFARAQEVSLLAALGALWEPLEAREAHGTESVEPVRTLGFAACDAAHGEASAAWVRAIETGRRVARDIGGTDPERMAPRAVADYCREVFADTDVRVEVVHDHETLGRDYPLLHAVARASLAVERHRPCVVRLEYAPAGPIHHSLLFAGKGVTYDTGGADIKAGGHMAGMSRDKGGAAAVAGLLRAAAALAPAGVHIVAEIGAVRNSVGADAYVTDEILVGHSGRRVRVGNTDAEGRLVLADLLSHLRQRAVDLPDPRLFSVATLTGHAVRAVGPYTVAIDNGPARAAGVAERLAATGDAWGDPVEISRLRREDFDFVRPRSRADDVLSCNNAPSTMTDRGHQFPMAFLAMASGLAAHAGDSVRPLCHTHLDIAGSATEGCDWQHGRPTGAPIPALAAALLGTA